jgi:hypothetical protein
MYRINPLLISLAQSPKPIPYLTIEEGIVVLREERRQSNSFSLYRL